MAETRAEKMKKTLSEVFQPIHMELVDESHLHSGVRGSESHFKLILVSDEFESMSRVERQKRVHHILGDELNSGLHALSLRTFTAREWKKLGQGIRAISPTCISQALK